MAYPKLLHTWVFCFSNRQGCSPSHHLVPVSRFRRPLGQPSPKGLPLSLTVSLTSCVNQRVIGLPPHQAPMGYKGRAGFCYYCYLNAELAFTLLFFWFISVNAESEFTLLFFWNLLLFFRMFFVSLLLLQILSNWNHSTVKMFILMGIFSYFILLYLQHTFSYINRCSSYIELEIPFKI